MFKKLEAVNEVLMQDASAIKNAGLLNGKMGISIYFFHLARITKKTEHQRFAEKLVDEVYEEVSTNHLTLDFENGLAGIAWGIEYLVQDGFVEADTDTILSEVDDKIYQYIVGAEELPIGVMRGVLGYILYVLSRVHRKDLSNIENSDNFIFGRLLIDLINRMDNMIEERNLAVQEPLLFDLCWDLPLCLITLGRIHEMNFYLSKINRIIEHLSPLVISTYPSLNSNRLYLLLGIKRMLRQVDLPNWRNHAGLLKRNTQLADILHKELKNKNLDFKHGVAGIDFVSRQLYQLTKDKKLLFKRGDLIEKIIASEYWNKLNQNELERKRLGLLFYGLAGVGLELLELLKTS